MIDVDVSFVNISANNDNNNNNNNSPLSTKFQPNFSTWVIIGEFDNFCQIFKLLNVILDQFMDCNAIIDHYTHMAVDKLDQIVFKSLNLVKIVSSCLHWTPIRVAIASFSNFGHQRCSLLVWFPKKSADGGGV